MFARCIDNTQDDYHIILFKGSESLKSGKTLKHHLNLTDGPHRPSDQFLHLHFRWCLAVGVCCGDVTEDYEEQEIENFLAIMMVKWWILISNDPRWSTPLGLHVHAYLIREKLAEASVILFLFVWETQNWWFARLLNAATRLSRRTNPWWSKCKQINLLKDSSSPEVCLFTFWSSRICPPTQTSDTSGCF